MDSALLRSERDPRTRLRGSPCLQEKAEIGTLRGVAPNGGGRAGRADARAPSRGQEVGSSNLPGPTTRQANFLFSHATLPRGASYSQFPGTTKARRPMAEAALRAKRALGGAATRRVVAIVA